MASKHCILLVTVLAANFGCKQFRIMPEIVSKLLHTAIWSCCAVQLESEQMPLMLTGSQFGSAALHRIQFATYWFVPMPYFYSETSAWWKDWAKQWALLRSVINYHQFHWTFYLRLKFHFIWKKILQWLPKLTNHWILLALKLGPYCKSDKTLSSREHVVASNDYHVASNDYHSLAINPVLACPSCARALTQEPG